ncbi:hypothetical protein ACN27B_08855 [Micromonospora sp. WMMD754]|uniref:hypothetical protein n=1 Tax=Micromonospora sp. WMMD754 TaxID=3404114 RepID=UPI003BF5EA40
MYHQAKRPTAVLWSIAGGVCALGGVSVVARALDTYTHFTLREPFDSLSFALALICWFTGPAMVGWLRALTYKQQAAEMAHENRLLREDRRRIDQLAEAIQRVDQQAEINTVLLRKVMKTLEEQQIPVGDTQPIGRLHSINGGGGA